MRLAEYTDYTLRVLVYCASHTERGITIAELATQHRLSKNHLMKIVNDLARQGLVETTRGGGGLRPLMHPGDITVGAVVRHAASDFRLVECFDARTNDCSLTPGCRLKGKLGAALRACFRELDAATLAEIVAPAARDGRPSGKPRAAVHGAPMAAPGAASPADRQAPCLAEASR
jgi:Rrf2 family nitric oxide-sensitive transcriptional repressor